MNLDCNFCPHCGNKLQLDACSQCDATLIPGHNFCWKCGHENPNNPNPVATEPEPPPQVSEPEEEPEEVEVEAPEIVENKKRSNNRKRRPLTLQTQIGDHHDKILTYFTTHEFKHYTRSEAFLYILDNFAQGWDDNPVLPFSKCPEESKRTTFNVSQDAYNQFEERFEEGRGDIAGFIRWVIEQGAEEAVVEIPDPTVKRKKPRVRNQPGKCSITIGMSEVQLDFLETEAKNQEVSRSKQLEKLLREDFNVLGPDEELPEVLMDKDIHTLRRTFEVSRELVEGIKNRPPGGQYAGFARWVLDTYIEYEDDEETEEEETEEEFEEEETEDGGEEEEEFSEDPSDDDEDEGENETEEPEPEPAPIFTPKKEPVALPIHTSRAEAQRRRNTFNKLLDPQQCSKSYPKMLGKPCKISKVLGKDSVRIEFEDGGGLLVPLNYLKDRPRP